jgi:hypothetical protein
VDGLAVSSVEVAPALKLSRAVEASEFRVTIEDAGGGPSALDAFLAVATPAALEAAGCAFPGLVESVTVAERCPAGAVLSYVTRHVDGRYASPRVLEKLESAAGLDFRHLKRGRGSRRPARPPEVPSQRCGPARPGRGRRGWEGPLEKRIVIHAEDRSHADRHPRG